MDAVFKYLKGDRVIWVIALLLALISIPAVYSSIVTLAYKYQDGNTFYYLFKHAFMLVTGFFLMYHAHRLKFSYYSRLSQIAIWVVIGLLLLTLIIGANINSASRWLTIPIINQNFQTSDFAKLVLIVYVARVLSMRQDNIRSFKESVLPVIIPVAAVCALILPANFSTAAVLFTSCFVLMFIGRIATKHLLAIVGSGLAVLAIITSMWFAQPEFTKTVLPRVDTWMTRLTSKYTGESKANYQVEQAKIAIASGGLLGQLPGNGSSRNTLPHPYSDMIYAFIIQEYGSIVGGVGILVLYLMLLYRAVRIATKCEKTFGAFMAIGLSFNLVLQALVNMAVAVNLLPVTGQPLPLVSMGGTSTWFTCITIGIILSVSRSVYKDEQVAVSEKVEKEYAIA